MALKDRLRSAISSSSRSSTSSKSSASSSTSFTCTTATNVSSYSSSKDSGRKLSPSSAATNQKVSKKSSFFRSKRHRTDVDQEWVDPPLKYTEPPIPAVVDMLAAWDWNSGSTVRWRDSYGSDVSPTSMIGWI